MFLIIWREGTTNLQRDIAFINKFSRKKKLGYRIQLPPPQVPLGGTFNFHKLLFLNNAEKRQIAETAIFGGWWRQLIILSVYDHIKRLHKKIGWSRAVLKFGSWQLKNGKITGRK